MFRKGMQLEYIGRGDAELGLSTGVVVTILEDKPRYLFREGKSTFLYLFEEDERFGGSTGVMPHYWRVSINNNLLHTFAPESELRPIQAPTTYIVFPTTRLLPVCGDEYDAPAVTPPCRIFSKSGLIQYVKENIIGASSIDNITAALGHLVLHGWRVYIEFIAMDPDLEFRYRKDHALKERKRDCPLCVGQGCELCSGTGRIEEAGP